MSAETKNVAEEVMDEQVTLTPEQEAELAEAREKALAEQEALKEAKKVTSTRKGQIKRAADRKAKLAEQLEEARKAAAQTAENLANQAKEAAKERKAAEKEAAKLEKEYASERAEIEAMEAELAELTGKPLKKKGNGTGKKRESSPKLVRSALVRAMTKKGWDIDIDSEGNAVSGVKDGVTVQFSEDDYQVYDANREPLTDVEPFAKGAMARIETAMDEHFQAVANG